MKKICFFLLLFAAYKCNAQTYPAVDTARYFLETRQFIQFIRDTFHIRDTVVLVDSAICRQGGPGTATDTGIVRYRLAHPVFHTWNESLFGKGRIVPEEKILAIFKAGGWAAFHKTYGRIMFRLSAPIFLQDYTYCLVALDVSGGPTSGGGFWALYRKVGRKWVRVKVVNAWVS